MASGTVADPLSFSPSATPSLTYTLTNLTPGTHYSVRVGCRNTVGVSGPSTSLNMYVHQPAISLQLSEWSGCVSFNTAPGPPSAPCSPSVTMVTAHSAQLQWMVSLIPILSTFHSLLLCGQASMEFGSTVVGYEVEWGTVGGARHTKRLPHSPCVASLIHLTPDTEHTARVKVGSTG